jgi:hydroxyethylthiazole kinase-like uncharacterized protein yjeF
MKNPVSREEMADVDRKVPERYGITISRMMENAGLQIAEFLRKELKEESFTFYAGKGNNGGDALAAARRMHLWGYEVEVVLATKDLDGIREEELEILRNLRVEINLESSEKEYSVAVEGLIGYNLKGDPRPPFDSMIEEIDKYETVVSIDIGSGLDGDTGEEALPCVRPDYTVTLAAPFEGMTEENSGEVWLADISVPPEAFEAQEAMEEVFRQSSLVRLDVQD